MIRRDGRGMKYGGEDKSLKGGDTVKVIYRLLLTFNSVMIFFVVFLINQKIVLIPQINQNISYVIIC